MKNEITYLMTVNGFSKEATIFVAERGDRYMPLLATLANFSAKAIDPSFYDMKDEMLNRMESIASRMGWRTFQSYDSTIAYPYIFYVDCGYAPQVSFHNAYERETTWRGKWSQISVQEIAPKLVANLMKKDGFTGDVWDYSLMTVNLMQVANVHEADHLHKGISYNFSCESNELVVIANDEQIEPSKALLQSFMTRLAKQIKAHTSESDEIGEDGLKESETQNGNATEVSPQNEGITEGCGTGSDEVDINESASKSEDADGSDSPHRDGIGNDGGSECGIDGVGNDTTDATSIDDMAQADEKAISDLDSRDSEGIATTPEQVSKPAKQSATQANGLSDVSKNGTYEFLKNLDEKATSSKGGGAQLNTRSKNAKSIKPNKVVTDALLRLASGESLSQKEFGTQKWDAKQVVKALVSSPQKLEQAKFQRPAEKVIFSVDTSGSVASFGNFIIEMIKSANDSPNISVFSGGEAWAEKNERTGLYVKPKNKWFSSFEESFENLLKVESPQIGSSIVFWGDAEMHKVDPILLKKMSMMYRCIWLYCHKKNDNKHYRWSTIKEVEQAGFKVVYGVNDSKTLAKAINSIL